MKFGLYLKDKLYVIILSLCIYVLMILFLMAFKADAYLIIALSLLFCSFVVIILLVDYFRKNKFYKDLMINIENLDKAYLVLETLEKPSFYEGEILYQALYEINKSMAENVQSLDSQVKDFKEYIEMWIHEVKLPISSFLLMAHNHRDKYDRKSIQTIKRIEDYVEQVLYYVRCENASKDYLIKETQLSKIVSNVALKNKDDLLENKIDFQIEGVSVNVLTDAKWLEFILNQIVNNSIKYKRTGIDSYIKIYAREESDYITINVEDNGVGIKSDELPRVFDKTFTGTNGRLTSKSTGMGLFIAKNLANKLGHKIEITSKELEFTRVTIRIAKNDFYMIEDRS